MSSKSPARCISVNHYFSAQVVGLRVCYTQAPLDVFANCAHLHAYPAIPSMCVCVGGGGATELGFESRAIKPLTH